MSIQLVSPPVIRHRLSDRGQAHDWRGRRCLVASKRDDLAQAAEKYSLTGPLQKVINRRLQLEARHGQPGFDSL